MSSKPHLPIWLWVALTILVIPLIVAVAAPFIVAWINMGVAERGMEGFWVPILSTVSIGLIALALLALALSFLLHTWRGAIWAPFARWVADTWPTRRITARSRETAARENGYNTRSAEVDAERARTPKPKLYVNQQGSLSSDDHHFMVWNSGYQVRDLEVTTDDTELVLRYPVFRSGPFGDDMPGGVKGHAFDGDLTDKGRAEGVTFNITYTDRAGDEHVEEYRLAPERLFVNTHESREEAYARGRAELQQEIDAQRARPIIEPQWLLGRDAKTDRYVISNSAAGSTARDVKLDAASQFFTFIGAPQWEDISVPADAEDPGLVGTRIFKGVPGDYGRSFGAKVSVSWTDENGDRCVRHEIPIHGTGRQF